MNQIKSSQHWAFNIKLSSRKTKSSMSSLSKSNRRCFLLGPNRRAVLRCAAIFTFRRPENKRARKTNPARGLTIALGSKQTCDLLDWFGWPGSYHSSNWQSAVHKPGDTFLTSNRYVLELNPSDWGANVCSCRHNLIGCRMADSLQIHRRSNSGMWEELLYENFVQ